MRAARLALWLLLSQLLLAACGGRLVKTEGDDDDGTGASSNSQGASTSSGARPGRAGSTGTGASTSQGGASTGTAGGIAVGGAVSTAGTTAGGCTTCPMIACPSGTQAVPNPNGCCYTCQPVAVCPDIPCALIGCGSGSHLEVLPGQCCPTCVADKCEDQRIAYVRMREQLLDKYRSLGCMTHQDCGIYYEKNACEIGCGVVVPNAAFDYLDQNLPSFAAQTCSPECPPLPLPCEPPGQPFCVNNRCQ